MPRNPSLWMLMLIALAAGAASTPAAAQASSSYRLEESVFNAGGQPVATASAGFRIELGSIGAGLGDVELASASYRLEAGFAPAYRPPSEVSGLHFTGKTALRWNGDRSAGHYNLYRGSVGSLAGLDYGACEQTSLATRETTDADPVPPGDAFYYLVTVENRLGEEGGKGTSWDGSPRTGTFCP